jgi:hypothetical protein
MRRRLKNSLVICRHIGVGITLPVRFNGENLKGETVDPLVLRPETLASRLGPNMISPAHSIPSTHMRAAVWQNTSVFLQ